MSSPSASSWSSWLFSSQGAIPFDVWGQQQHLGSVLTQVKSTMLVTLWVFLGIEAAVVVSDRAQDPPQVGMATFVGLAVCTVLYFLLSALPFGVMHQKDLAGLGNPSSAYVLQALVGHWGAIFVNFSVLFSVLFCWLAWTILVAELPYEGAKGGVFPKFLALENRHHAAAPSLWMSSIVMQITMFVVLFAQNAWIWLISITGVTSLPPYLASTAFLWLYASKTGYTDECLGNPGHGHVDGNSGYAVFGLASLCGRAAVSADVDDRLRHRPAGLLVCPAGAQSRQGRVHAHRAGGGNPSRHRRDRGRVLFAKGIVTIS